MRRSAAPSMNPPSKRRKFQPPYASNKSDVKEQCDSTTANKLALAECSRPGVSAVVNRFQSLGGSDSGCTLIDDASTSGSAAYFSVMWCKRSKKKHKTWEGDGICIVHDTVATLKDTEGKDIGRGTGYRLSELSGLTEGSTLVIGGKEIEVINQLSAEQWKSGKCFTGTPVSEDTSVKTISQSSLSVRKKFSVPSVEGHVSVPKKQVTVEPLYNPTASCALVMPRPSQRHQILHNQCMYAVVEVVVDPHLVVHLRPHQREGVTFLYECVMGMREFSGNGAILADEMGLGKTLQCISALWTLLKQGPYGRKPVVKKALILTPGSLVKNWVKEFHKWLGNERLRVFAVSTDNRVEEFVKVLQIYPVLIISYEMFMRTHELLHNVKFDIMICDEGHRLKNASAKTTSIIMKLPIKRRILLSGTPIQNDLQEFYSIVECCNPGVLGSCSSFSRVFEAPIVQSRQPTASLEEKEVGEKRAIELRSVTSFFFLRRTQEVNKEYLPPKVESVVFCRVTGLQLALYQCLLNSRLVKSCLTSTDISPHLVCINALKKVCNSPGLVYQSAVASSSSGNTTEHKDLTSLYGAVLDQFPNDYATEHGIDSGKLIVLAEMLQYVYTHTVEKIVLVSHYTKTLDILEKLCCSIGFKCLRLDGSTACTLRQSIVDRFNNKHSPESIFLLSSKAGGVGLNLIGASRLILFDIDWNPATDLQAMARVWREGQIRSVHLYRLITTGTIEEKIFQRQICKQGLSLVVNFDSESSSKTMKFTAEDLKDLFTLRENTLCDTHDLLKCSCKAGQNKSVCRRTSCKKPGSDDLLEWKHFHQPIQDAGIEDKLLLAASSYISFVFQKDTV